MRVHTLVSLGLIFTTSTGFAQSASDSPPKPMPHSLDAFYPPTAQAPIHLFEMLKLETFFAGILVNLGEDDAKGISKSYEGFKSQYQAVREMVPEWEGFYPTAPVEELGAVLKKGERGEVMAAYEKVGGICHNCHIHTMVPVQQKYHWGDFMTISLTDPVIKENVPFSLFKKFLSTSMAGITVNMAEGQPENALTQYKEFELRFTTLQKSCFGCHKKEPRSFVDPSVKEFVVKLGEVLSVEDFKPEKVQELTQAIGRESCFKCHLVHLPAAFSRIK